jgi:hypothetical protein
MGIGSFLVGAGQAMRGYNQGVKDIGDQEYTDRVRQSAVADLDATDSLRSQRTGAQSAALGLQTASNQAALDALPAKTKLAATQGQIAQQQADQDIGNLPQLFNAQDTDLASRLADSKRRKTEADYSLQDAPQHIRRLQAEGVLNDERTRDAATSAIVHAIGSGDHGAVTQTINDLIGTGMFPDWHGKKVADWRIDDSPQGKMFTILDDQGQAIRSRPAAQMLDVYNRLTPQKVTNTVYQKGAGVLQTDQNGNTKVVVAPQPADDIKEGRRLLVNDGIRQLGQAFGAKLDPRSQLLDTSSIKDIPGYEAGTLELERRVLAGESPMTVAADISGRARRRAALRDAGVQNAPPTAGPAGVPSQGTAPAAAPPQPQSYSSLWK